MRRFSCINPKTLAKASRFLLCIVKILADSEDFPRNNQNIEIIANILINSRLIRQHQEFHQVSAKMASKCSDIDSPPILWNIQCGVCKNVMSSAAFLAHKERKHPMFEFVTYVKVPACERKHDTNISFIKCKYCPNKVPEQSMDKHMKKCHISCHVCGNVVFRMAFDQHMQRKHSFANTMNGSMSHENFFERKYLNNDGAVKEQRSSRSSSVSVKSEPANIRINEYQLAQFIRQGRVYRKDGFLYLRNVDHH